MVSHFRTRQLSGLGETPINTRRRELNSAPLMLVDIIKKRGLQKSLLR